MITKERIQKQIVNAQARMDKLELDQENLNDHGYWSLGCWKGKLGVLEDIPNDIEENKGD